MKKFLGSLLLGLLLLSGCSEEKKQSKAVKEEDHYLKTSIMKKLGEIDQIYMKQLMKELFEKKRDDLPMLMLFYTDPAIRMDYCDAHAEILSESDPKKKKEMYEDLYLKQTVEECEIYREIYEKYNYMYLEIVNTNLIPTYFYFEFIEDYSKNRSDVGIFPTKKECEYYSNLFREKDIGLTSNCKKGFSPNK